MNQTMTAPKKTKANAEIFSWNLLRLMNKKGADVSAMSKDLKIEESRIWKWTKGQCFPKYDMMIKICNYLNYFDIYKFVTEPIDLT